MSDIDQESNSPIENQEIPEIPNIIKENPRKKAIWIFVSLIIFSFIISIIFAFVFNILFLNHIGVSGDGVFKWIPGNFVVELMIIWTFPVLSFLLIMLIARFISIFYIWLHKIVKFGQYDYSFVEMQYSFVKITQALGRVLVPVLLSFTIGYWFTNLLRIDEAAWLVVQTFEFFLYAFILAPITVILIVPLWLLDDSGIISIKKRKENERKLPDIEGPSTFFVNFLTGSAYSLAVVTLYDFIKEIISTGEPALFGALAYMVVMLFIEWFVIIYLYEIFVNKMRIKLQEKLPQKLVDTNPKVITDQKVVAKLKSIDAILSED
ncbi:MAG: hypothetical protein ACFFDW_10530 [Candidatus Thorarchaeota archaeon]